MAEAYLTLEKPHRVPDSDPYKSSGWIDVFWSQTVGVCKKNANRFNFFNYKSILFCPSQERPYESLLEALIYNKKKSISVFLIHLSFGFRIHRFIHWGRKGHCHDQASAIQWHYMNWQIWIIFLNMCVYLKIVSLIHGQWHECE